MWNMVPTFQRNLVHSFPSSLKVWAAGFSEIFVPIKLYSITSQATVILVFIAIRVSYFYKVWEIWGFHGSDKNNVFWNMIPCSQKVSNILEESAAFISSSPLKTDAVGSYEPQVNFYQITWCHMPEDNSPHVAEVNFVPYYTVSQYCRPCYDVLHLRIEI